MKNNFQVPRETWQEGGIDPPGLPRSSEDNFQNSNSVRGLQKEMTVKVTPLEVGTTYTTTYGIKTDLDLDSFL